MDLSVTAQTLASREVVAGYRSSKSRLPPTAPQVAAVETVFANTADTASSFDTADLKDLDNGPWLVLTTVTDDKSTITPVSETVGRKALADFCANR